MEIIGWYPRSKWIKTFRPDGIGHITIAGGDEPPVDIPVEDIVCDKCNADAGTEQAEGGEPLIYFDGSMSLCRRCGLKAEAAYLEEVRAALKRRGWPTIRIDNLTVENLREIAHEWSVDEALGTSPAEVAKNLHWDCFEATLWAARLLEEVNEHKLAKVLFDAVADKPGK